MIAIVIHPVMMMTMPSAAGNHHIVRTNIKNAAHASTRKPNATHVVTQPVCSTAYAPSASFHKQYRPAGKAVAYATATEASILITTPGNLLSSKQRLSALLWLSIDIPTAANPVAIHAASIVTAPTTGRTQT
jgi:hypothetical protein